MRRLAGDRRGRRRVRNLPHAGGSTRGGTGTVQARVHDILQDECPSVGPLRTNRTQAAARVLAERLSHGPRDGLVVGLLVILSLDNRL